MSKFDSSSLLSSTVDSDILDLIDCFHGIALSMRAETSQAIFDYLTPVCIRCIDLLSSRKDSRSIVDGVLGFFQSLCKKLSSFFESDQLSLLYEIVMQLIMAYSKNHICKYRTRGADEEDQISDLICFIEILDSAVSTGPIFGNLAEPSSGLSGGTVAIRGLQELLPLMNGSVMSFPPVCKAFYRFMLRISEEIPDCFKNMDLSLFDLIIECLRKAIASEYGQEIAYLSLQTIDELASNASKWLNKELTAKLTSLVEDTFLACLVLSSDEQLLVRGTFALFGLICLDQAVFGAYVQSLLNRQANRPIREMLEHAFSALLPSPPSSATRGEKRAFSRRFESFVEAVRGQLVLD
ncbi:hypothetical protein AB6A40_004217 [Gnathostoma spinigerum]|uniref:Exportin-4 n=1 Tax=Gnathostoma spinigerum TaxID=75299 RepID=A0ABD6EC07_9BILA